MVEEVVVEVVVDSVEGVLPEVVVVVADSGVEEDHRNFCVFYSLYFSSE